MKHIKLFENFISKRGGEEIISEIITFSLTDEGKSWFEYDTWIKKWETDREIKSDDSDLVERIKKIGEVKYLLDDFQINFGYANLAKEYPFVVGNLSYGPNKKLDLRYNKEYKSNLEKVYNLTAMVNPDSGENFQALEIGGLQNEIENITQLLFHTGKNSPKYETFLVGYGTIEAKEKIESEWGDPSKLNSYERYNYYCLVTVGLLYNTDESIELYPSRILVKAGEKPNEEEIIRCDRGPWCKITRKEWEMGLKPGDTDHRGFFKIDSVEDYLARGLEDVRKID